MGNVRVIFHTNSICKYFMALEKLIYHVVTKTHKMETFTQILCVTAQTNPSSPNIIICDTLCQCCKKIILLHNLQRNRATHKGKSRIPVGLTFCSHPLLKISLYSGFFLLKAKEVCDLLNDVRCQFLPLMQHFIHHYLPISRINTPELSFLTSILLWKNIKPP